MVTVTDIIAMLVLLFGISGLVFNIKKRAFCFILLGISNVLFMVNLWFERYLPEGHIDNYLLATQMAAYLFASIVGYVTWRRKEIEKKCGRKCRECGCSLRDVNGITHCTNPRCLNF